MPDFGDWIKYLSNPLVLIGVGIICLTLIILAIIKWKSPPEEPGGDTINISGGNVGTAKHVGDVINIGVSDETLRHITDKYHATIDKLIAEKNLTPDAVKGIEELLGKIDAQVSALSPAEPEKDEIEACLREGDLHCSIKSITELYGKRLLKVDEDKASAAQAALMLARSYRLKFDHINARKYYTEAAALDPENAEINFSYGSFLYNNRSFTDAKQHLEKALTLYRALAKKEPGKYLPTVAGTQNNLGLLYKDTGRHDEAERAYNEARRIFKGLAMDNPGAYLRAVAGTQNNLGELYRITKMFGKAEPLYDSALKIYQGLAKDNPGAYLLEVAMTQNNLGVLYYETGRYPKAEQVYVEPLKIYQELAKEYPAAYLPYVALTQNNLGGLYVNVGRYDDAEKALIDALNIRQKLAEKNPGAYLLDVALTQNNLGALYYETDRHTDAEKAYNEALRIYKGLAEKNTGAYLPNAIMTIENLGLLYEKMGKLEDSARYYKMAEEKQADLDRYMRENKQE